MNKSNVTKKIGRPGVYDPDYHPSSAYKLCSFGMTDSDLAKYYEVSEQTIINWRNQHPEFYDSVKRGKTIADANVAHSLYKLATGYSVPQTLTFELQKGEFAWEVETRETIKHYPPDTRAAELWLRNRRPGFFKLEADSKD